MKEFMHKYFRNSTVFQLAFGILVGLALLTGDFAPVYAQEDRTDRLFTIRDIKVDEVASRASQARETALERAELQAYQTLIRKLAQEDGRQKLPELTRPEIQSLITAIEVVEEQSSSRRYLATLNVRFEPGLVSELLAKYSVPHVLSTGQGILVMHGHKRGLTELLWEQDETIRAARERVDWVNRIREYVFPRGEISERAAITFAEVQALSSNEAKQVALRYGVRDALLIASEWTTSWDGPVLNYRYRSTDGNMQGEGMVDDAADEATALAAMYERVLDTIDSAWRSQLLVDTGVGGEIVALVPTTSLDILADIQARLKDVSLVRDARAIEIGLPFSRIAFSYTGREDQLVLALRYAGLDLSQYGRDRLLGLRVEGE